MRLTLRTLLAWLDDTLSPGEVREIGKQVAESPFAKELRDRIQLVSRQRRLTVPNGNGPDGADPNLVAAYLDNELDPERVGDFEKKCLTSDVHLAEVASVHQILSLIGQKAKVPTEARNRMYQLIKGRESVAPKVRRKAEAAVRTVVSEPIQPWITPEPPTRSWYERYLPGAAALALFVVLCVSSWLSLTSPEPTPARSLDDLKNAAALAEAKKGHAGEKKDSSPVEGTTAKEIVPVLEPVAKNAGAEGTPKGAADDDASTTVARANSPTPAATKEEENSLADLPAGSIGTVAKTSGIILRFNADPEVRAWQAIQPRTVLKSQDRVLSLAPFRSTLDFGKSKVELVGETEIWARSTLSNLAGRFSLIQGRVIVQGSNPPLPIEVQFAGGTVQITPPAGVAVGLERLNRRDPGSPKPQGAILRVYVPSGEATLTVDSTKETLTGPGSISFEPPGRWADRSSDPVPSWVTSPAPRLDVQLGEQLVKLIRPDASIITSLVEALGEESREIRSLAISALRAIGDVDYIVPVLNSTDQVSRRAAIGVLRAFLAQSPEAAQAIEKQVIEHFGPELGQQVDKLLIGFTAKEAKDDSTYEALVRQLASTDDVSIGLRELALDNLQSLTGRDDLGYDAAKPEGKALKAWQDLNSARMLRPTSSAAPKAAAPDVEKVPPPPEPVRPETKDKKETPKEPSSAKSKDRTVRKKESDPAGGTRARRPAL